MRKFVFYILFALSAAACIYPYDAELPSDTPKRLVVSGDILIGEQSPIDLSYVRPLSATFNIDGALPEGSVRVENDKGQFFLGRPGKNGRFTVDTRLAREDALYRLVVKLKDGREYNTPWTGVNAAPVIEDLSYDYDETNVHIYCTLDGRDSIRNFRWDYEEVWEYHADFIPDFVYTGRGQYLSIPKYKNYYYCWDQNSSIEPLIASAEDLTVNRVEHNNFITIGRTDNKMSYLYSVNLTVTGLSHSARVYLEHIRDFSTLTGDLFSPTPSEMRGNIYNVSDPKEPVVGFVSVCKRATRRLFIEASGIHISTVNPDHLLFIPEPNEYGWIDYDWYFEKNSPVREEMGTGILWAPKRCVDCRVRGGTKNKPEWWPNDDV
ncbi:MAG: DUF4249 family protein [Bacteroidales bacterium]|nr:DUF4249 family protein [Bacteroidales bacterium]